MATWLIGILLVLLLGAVVTVAAGRGEGLAPAETDAPVAMLPTDRPLRAQDLRDVRFSTAVRGYRAEEVDALLRRLADEIGDDDR